MKSWLGLGLGVIGLALFAGLGARGQGVAGGSNANLTATSVAKVRVPYFIDPVVFRGALLVRAPAKEDSGTTRAELEEEHRVEQMRTPAEVAAAQYDDAHEDIFLYAGVLGEGFGAAGLPVTAAFSAHIRNDSGVVNAPLKERFKRARPYNLDASLHPVCKTGGVTDFSYPSGHTMVGYLMGLTVAQMVPEKSGEILARAEGYARNRVVCGVHYPSDLEASRAVAYAMFGYLLATPRFERELAAATIETRRKLGLSELPMQ